MIAGPHKAKLLKAGARVSYRNPLSRSGRITNSQSNSAQGSASPIKAKALPILPTQPPFPVIRGWMRRPIMM